MGKIFHGGFNDPQSWSVPWQNPKAVTYALPENEALSSVKMAGEPDGEKGDNTGAALGSYSLPWNPPASSKEATNDPIEQQPKLKKGAVAIATSDAVAGDVQVSRHNSRGPAYECADVPDNTYTDGKVADLAVKTLREISKKPEPFFLAVGFIKPHLPFVAPKKYWDLYDPAKIELAPNPFRPIGAPDYAILPGGELRLYHDIPEEHLPDDLARKLKHGYYAGVSYSDAQIGRVLAELDRLNLRTNTIIILWGDHGWKLGEHDAWCKHTDVENDVNAPLILSVPGMKNAGAHSKALVEFVDVYPTLSELTGLPLPSHLEGTSFKPLLDDPNRAWKSAVFSQYPRTQKGGLMGYTMGTDRYRFTVWVSRKDHAKIDATELYDHLNDPQENTNIVNHADQAVIVEQLMAQWKKGWQGAKPLTKN